MSKKRLDLQMFADASAQLQNTTGAAGMTAEIDRKSTRLNSSHAT